MFLKKIKKISQKIDFKITLWNLSFLVVSFCFLFIVFYWLYSQLITNKDHETIEAKFQEHQAIYYTLGVTSLNTYLQKNLSSEENETFFLRVENSNHKTIFFKATKQEKNFSLLEIETTLLKFPLGKKWYYIKTKEGDHDIELRSAILSDGNTLQVGKSVEDHDLLFERFKIIFFETLAFALIIGGFGGMFLSRKLLLPIRNLITALKSIQNGNENARVPHNISHDELDELVALFNQMQERIQTSNQGMRHTLDIIAHELRTPLTSIRGLAEITLQKRQFSESEFRKVLEDCIEGIDIILSEFKMMTDITEVESGLNNLDKSEVNLHAICKDIIDMYEIVAEQKEISITLAPDNGIKIFADKKKLRRVLANLIDNAIKYSPPQTNINILFLRDYKNAVLKIQDQGIGIKTKDLPLIWKRLYRGENSRSEKGIGLGLSLVKSIIEAHNGNIFVENNNGQGCTFTISLPIK